MLLGLNNWVLKKANLYIFSRDPPVGRRVNERISNYLSPLTLNILEPGKINYFPLIFFLKNLVKQDLSNGFENSTPYISYTSWYSELVVTEDRPLKRYIEGMSILMTILNFLIVYPFRVSKSDLIKIWSISSLIFSITTSRWWSQNVLYGLRAKLYDSRIFSFRIVA